MNYKFKYTNVNKIMNQYFDMITNLALYPIRASTNILNKSGSLSDGCNNVLQTEKIYNIYFMVYDIHTHIYIILIQLINGEDKERIKDGPVKDERNRGEKKSCNCVRVNNVDIVAHSFHRSCFEQSVHSHVSEFYRNHCQKWHYIFVETALPGHVFSATLLIYPKSQSHQLCIYTPYVMIRT